MATHHIRSAEAAQPQAMTEVPVDKQGRRINAPSAADIDIYDAANRAKNLRDKRLNINQQPTGSQLAELTNYVLPFDIWEKIAGHLGSRYNAHNIRTAYLDAKPDAVRRNLINNLAQTELWFNGVPDEHTTWSDHIDAAYVTWRGERSSTPIDRIPQPLGPLASTDAPDLNRILLLAGQPWQENKIKTLAELRTYLTYYGDVVHRDSQNFCKTLEICCPTLLSQTALIFPSIMRANIGGATSADRARLALGVIKNNDSAYSWLDSPLKANRSVILAALSHPRHGIESIPDALADDKEVVWAAAKTCFEALRSASANMRRDRDVVLSAVRFNGFGLQWAAPELTDTHEVVLAAVTQHGHALQHASARLRADPSIVLAAVKQCAFALQHAAVAIQENRRWALEAVQTNAEALEPLKQEFKNDSEIVLAAVRQVGLTLRHAGESVKNQSGVARVAVQNDGRALRHVSAALRDDSAIVTAAVAQNGNALLHASMRLKNNARVVLTAVHQSGGALQFASEKLRTNKKLRVAALRQDPAAMAWVAEGLPSEKKAALRQAAGEPAQKAPGARLMRWLRLSPYQAR